MSNLRSSSSSATCSGITSLNQSPRIRRPQPVITDGLCRQQQLRSCRRALSGLLKSQSLRTTDYGWLDVVDHPRSHPNVSRSLTDLRPQSSDFQPAPDRVRLLRSGQVREALEPIQEAAEQTTVELDRRLRRIHDAGLLKSAITADKENVRPPPFCSGSGRMTTSLVKKSSNVDQDARHQTSSLPAPTAAASLSPNPINVRGTKDGDWSELGDVTSESSSCRRALISASCTLAADDEAVGEEAEKRIVDKPTEFQRGLTRRSFSLPRIKAKFSLKVRAACFRTVAYFGVHTRAHTLH